MLFAVCCCSPLLLGRHKKNGPRLEAKGEREHAGWVRDS